MLNEMFWSSLAVLGLMVGMMALALSPHAEDFCRTDECKLVQLQEDFKALASMKLHLPDAERAVAYGQIAKALDAAIIPVTCKEVTINGKTFSCPFIIPLDDLGDVEIWVDGSPITIRALREIS